MSNLSQVNCVFRSEFWELWVVEDVSRNLLGYQFVGAKGGIHDGCEREPYWLPAPQMWAIAIGIVRMVAEGAIASDVHEPQRRVPSEDPPQ